MIADRLVFTSDTHFGHRKMLELRNYSSIEAMDEWQIQKWNDTVGHDDHVFHLGDVSFRSNPDTLAILKRLRGKKHLVRGNHDRNMNGAVKACFESIEDYRELKTACGQMIVLMHFPIESWNKMAYGTWHLHGHSHGNMEGFGMRADVGIDVWGSPVRHSELTTYFTDQPIETRDHHKMALEDL